MLMSWRLYWDTKDEQCQTAAGQDQHPYSHNRPAGRQGAGSEGAFAFNGMLPVIFKVK